MLIATLAMAGLYLATAEKVYEARADVLVTPVPTQDAVLSTIGVITQSPDPTLDVETGAQLIDSPAVAERAADELGGSEGTAERTLDAVSVEPIPDSNVVAIVAQGPSPESASDRANAFAEAAVAERQQEIQENIDEILPQLQQDLANSAGGTSADSLAALIAQLSAFRAGRNPGIQVETPATPPSEPSSPRTILVIVFALIVGLGLGIGSAFAAQVLDPRLRREEQLRSLFRLPILARITRERDGSGSLPPERLSPIAREGYRTLRATIAAAGQSETGPRSIVVGGSGPSEGKSTTAINLAASLTLGGNRVILIEADVRRPVIGKALGITPRNGVISVLLGVGALQEALTKVPAYGPDLNVLVAEETGVDFAELFSLPAAERLLREATQGGRLRDRRLPAAWRRGGRLTALPPCGCRTDRGQARTDAAQQGQGAGRASRGQQHQADRLRLGRRPPGRAGELHVSLGGPRRPGPPARLFADHDVAVWNDAYLLEELPRASELLDLGRAEANHDERG